MNRSTFSSRSPRTSWKTRLALLALAGLVWPVAVSAEEPVNYITFGIGGVRVKGNDAAYTARNNIPESMVGGITGFHFEKWVDDGAFLTIDGHALKEIEDYRIVIDYAKPDVISFQLGFEQFRSWSNNATIVFPGSTYWSAAADPLLYLDRSKFWVETTIGAEGKPQYRLRYTRIGRHGSKASTAWAATNLAGSNRSIAPTYRDIDEARHEVLIDVIFRPDVGTQYAGGVRIQKTETNGRHQQRRNPGEASQSYVTQREDFDTDLFSVHGSAQRQINDQLRLSTGANWTTLSGTVSRDRITGNDYNLIFAPNLVGSQQVNLIGKNNLKQFVGTVAGVYTPTENLVIVPSLRFQRTYSDQSNTFDDVSINSSLVATTTKNALDSERDYNLLTGAVQGRYTGLKNITLTAGVTGAYGTGHTDELFLNVTNPVAPTIRVDRADEDTRRNFQLDAGAHWRINKTVRVSLNARHKRSSFTQDVVRDSTSNAIVGGDRYPLYIQRQEFTTNNINARLYLRLNPRLTSISRIDYQIARTDSQTFFLPEVESRDHERLALSQGFAYQPLTRLSLQATVNVVSNMLRTPANTPPGQPRHGLVTESDNGYIYGHVSAFYSISDATSLMMTYQGVFVDAWYNNSFASVPLGQQLNEHTATACLTHRFSEHIRVSLDYAFQHSRTTVTAGRTNYDSHMIGTRLQYRF